MNLIARTNILSDITMEVGNLPKHWINTETKLLT